MTNAVTLWLCMEDSRFSTKQIARCTSPYSHLDCRFLTVIEPVEST